ncbi:MAG: hypothetical protein DBY28_04120 [Subdoligranulum sp.]|jgi:hypothetical protein|nr:MAG: hypothetical protein DBY28_04120 [Subdoligranulum sp.]
MRFFHFLSGVLSFFGQIRLEIYFNKKRRCWQDFWREVSNESNQAATAFGIKRSIRLHFDEKYFIIPFRIKQPEVKT